MNKTKNIIKDRILEVLDSNKIKSPDDIAIAKVLKLDIFDVAFILEELQMDGLVELIAISSKDVYRKAYLANISNKGKYFIKYDSFLNQYKDYRRNKIWKIVKIIAAVLNALAIILLAAIEVFCNT
jgi:hypothetical protein